MGREVDVSPLFGVISGRSLTLRYSAEESPGSRRADPKRFSLDMGELSVLASIPFPQLVPT